MSRSLNGTSDLIDPSFTTDLTPFTWAMWAYLTNYGEGGKGRLLDKGQGAMLVNSADFASPVFNLYRNFTLGVGDGSWTVAAPTTAAWHHFAVTYDDSSVLNDPILYIDGVSQTPVTEVDTPVGSAISSAGTSHCIGSNAATTRVFNGQIAHVHLYSRILSANEIVGIMHFPGSVQSSLVAYFPLHGAATECNYIGTQTAAVLTGTTASANNPPINGQWFPPCPVLAHGG